MITRVAVVIPAADEEGVIGDCLAAVCTAADAVPVPVRIVVVLDACTDATAQVVARRPGVETVTSSARNVGQARRTGAAHALRNGDPRELWLANTDADSQVPPDWLALMLDLAETADLVLGTVLPDTGLHPSVEREWFAGHVAHDGHPHVHAANLGVRGDAYVALGGWQPLAVHEDVDLVGRAVDAGLRVHRTGLIPVRTSTRAIGRAPGGFATYLSDLGHV